jgi:HTH-type transcriptional regulator/antitoxin HipB
MQADARDLAEAIRELRKKHGISQGELAQISGVSLPSISRFERGKDTIRLDVLMKILDALGYRLEIKAKEKINGKA